MDGLSAPWPFFPFGALRESLSKVIEKNHHIFQVFDPGVNFVDLFPFQIHSISFKENMTHDRKSTETHSKRDGKRKSSEKHMQRKKR